MFVCMVNSCIGDVSGVRGLYSVGGGGDGGRWYGIYRVDVGIEY